MSQFVSPRVSPTLCILLIIIIPGDSVSLAGSQESVTKQCRWEGLALQVIRTDWPDSTKHNCTRSNISKEIIISLPQSIFLQLKNLGSSIGSNTKDADYALAWVGGFDGWKVLIKTKLLCLKGYCCQTWSMARLSKHAGINKSHSHWSTCGYGSIGRRTTMQSMWTQIHIFIQSTPSITLCGTTNILNGMDGTDLLA